MTLNEAREQLISGIDHAAYRETDSSLRDSDKNRLFGSEHYKSGRPVYKPSPWAEGDFEGKMATLLRIAAPNCGLVLGADSPFWQKAYNQDARQHDESSTKIVTGHFNTCQALKSSILLLVMANRNNGLVFENAERHAGLPFRRRSPQESGKGFDF